jgi:superoxide dismutase
MQEAFSAIASNRFGSGWAWLGVRVWWDDQVGWEHGGLVLSSTRNQDNPLMHQVKATRCLFGGMELRLEGFGVWVVCLSQCSGGLFLGLPASCTDYLVRFGGYLLHGLSCAFRGLGYVPVPLHPQLFCPLNPKHETLNPEP